MRTIESSFNQAKNFDLCDDLFSLYSEINNSINIPDMSEQERIITLTWHFGGIICNGGFGYLYCANIKGGPHYHLTAEAFKKLGCDRCFSAFEESFRWYPDNTPPADVSERRHLLALVSEEEKTRVGSMFWSVELADFLGPYIRTHRAAIVKDLRARMPWWITRRFVRWRYALGQRLKRWFRQ